MCSIFHDKSIFIQHGQRVHEYVTPALQSEGVSGTTPTHVVTFNHFHFSNSYRCL